ncbi:MAG: hypothetical protein Q8P81_04205 [Nanoarchaeota archaeon]|nr:hypothetical protein [Nanoarchaeota archaeon]
MLESKLAYQDEDVQIWTSVDPEIFRNSDDRRIKRIIDLPHTFVLVNLEGDYDLTKLREAALDLAEEEAGAFFRFSVEDTAFYKRTGDSVRGDQSEYLMRINSLRELCNQLGINLNERPSEEGTYLIVFDPKKGYSIPVDIGS